jgi:hypothetical protein
VHQKKFVREWVEPGSRSGVQCPRRLITASGIICRPPATSPASLIEQARLEIAGGGGRLRTSRPTAPGRRALELLDLQLEGKQRIGGEAFANGQRLQENESLGG